MSGEKMLKEIFNTYEILNKQIFIVNGFNNLTLIIKFNNNNFYHLVGFHKTNIGLFIPYYIKSQEKKYKYIKNNLDRFENILKNQIAEKDSLYFRINYFSYILKLLGNENIKLYNLKIKVYGSLYKGDYGLYKKIGNLNCLLCLKEYKKINNYIFCIPQSWMVSIKPNNLIENKKCFVVYNIQTISKDYEKNYINKNNT